MTKQEAMVFLEKLLANGPMPEHALVKACCLYGMDQFRAAFQAATLELGLVLLFGDGGHEWEWELPTRRDPSPSDAEVYLIVEDPEYATKPAAQRASEADVRRLVDGLLEHMAREGRLKRGRKGKGWVSSDGESA
jgi:hypothetical protein